MGAASLRPFGSDGIMGTKRLATQIPEDATVSRHRDDQRPRMRHSRFTDGSFFFAGLEDPPRFPSLSLDVGVLQRHFPCTRFVFRSVRQVSHWDTGRPFFLISKRGRSLCRQEDERCPLMQDSLQRCQQEFQSEDR